MSLRSDAPPPPESQLEESSARPGSDEILFSKLKWLMLVRLLLATALLVSTLVVQVRSRDGEAEPPLLYGLIISMYFLSALYSFLIGRIKQLSFFAFVQLTGDALLATPLIYLTGGLESIFSFLYFLVIISASYLLYTPGAVYAATVSGVCYSVLVLYQSSRPGALDMVVPEGASVTSYVFYNITVNIFGFFLVAFLTSYLSEQLRKTREALLYEQQSFKELEEFNRKIIEHIQSGIVTADTRHITTYLNPSARELMGLRLEEVLGQPIAQFFPTTEDYPEARQSPLGEPVRWEEHYRRPDGRQLILGFSGSPLRDADGNQVGKVFIFEDLTRIKQLEERSRRDDRLKTIGRLAAGVAHEIRNPLASISGSIQVLSAGMDLDGENQALMNIVLRETDRLNGLITDFLQYVRQKPAIKLPLDLQGLVGLVLAGLRHHPKCSPEIRITSSLEHSLTILGDASQLEQVLWNLCLNAVEAMPEGGRLEVSTKDIDLVRGTDSPGVVISVRDSGPGIDPGLLEQIFDPFFSTKTGGTGLGLSMVEKIVQAHDGLVQVKSVPEGGTLFEVMLPEREITGGLEGISLAHRTIPPVSSSTASSDDME